ncbi:Phosphatidylinositol transfer protein 3 [Glycine max]|nr:Phosphatidylinositol transfer protein 3 [Glycine max]
MSVDLNKTASNGHDKMVISQEHQAKITKVRGLIGPLSDKESVYCSDASISRYLRSRNWNVKKAAQMLKQSLKWRKEYKPEEIRWEEVAAVAEKGMLYRPNYCDKYGRPVIVMRPCNKKSTPAQDMIKYFVYCMENAIIYLSPHQEQLAWLIDFQGAKMSDVSFKTSRETIHILQEYYPKHLGLAMLYKAPRIFQPFFTMLRPFLETELYNKVKFGYSDDLNTKKMLEDLFDMDKLESAFGGNVFWHPLSQYCSDIMFSMSQELKKAASKGHEKMVTSQEEQAKITEVRGLIGPLSDKESVYCSDASISRYLRSRNWNVKKAAQMLKQSLKWRKEYKPEEIRWEEVAEEAQTGMMYKPNYHDKYGRSVLVMRPCVQKSSSTQGQIKYFVYSIEHAILNLPPHQEQMVWLVDFQGFKLSDISFKVARESAHILQEYYPKQLGLIILYNAPMIFQPFFSMVKPFLETETVNKIKFGYSNNHNTKKIMEDLFDKDNLESAFGGNGDTGVDINKYAERMKEDDNKKHSFWTQAKSISSVAQNAPSDSIRDRKAVALWNEKLHT